MPDASVLICYDGSDHAAHAIRQAAELLMARSVTVLTVWQSTMALPAFAWANAGGAAAIDYVALDRRSEEAAGEVARQGVEIAERAGLQAAPLTERADGPIWAAIVRLTSERGATAVVLGARGLTGLRHLVLGSVSEGVTRHGTVPTLVIH